MVKVDTSYCPVKVDPAKEQAEKLLEGLKDALNVQHKKDIGDYSGYNSAKNQLLSEGARELGQSKFIEQRERCDRYSRTTIAPSEIERAEIRGDTISGDPTSTGDEFEVEQIPCKPIKGKIEPPPMINAKGLPLEFNPNNNAKLPAPFSDEVLLNVSAYGPISMSASQRDFTETSFHVSGRTSVFGDGAVTDCETSSSAPRAFLNSKDYTPIGFGGFRPVKSKQFNKPTEFGNRCNATVDYVSKVLHECKSRRSLTAGEKAKLREDEEKKRAEQNKKSAKVEKDIEKYLNMPMKLTKLSLPAGVGRWRPSYGSWGKAADTDGFFKKLLKSDSQAEATVVVVEEALALQESVKNLQETLSKKFSCNIAAVDFSGKTTEAFKQLTEILK